MNPALGATARQTPSSERAKSVFEWLFYGDTFYGDTFPQTHDVLSLEF